MVFRKQTCFDLAKSSCTQRNLMHSPLHGTRGSEIRSPHYHAWRHDEEQCDLPARVNTVYTVNVIINSGFGLGEAAWRLQHRCYHAPGYLQSHAAAADQPAPISRRRQHARARLGVPAGRPSKLEVPCAPSTLLISTQISHLGPFPPQLSCPKGVHLFPAGWLLLDGCYSVLSSGSTTMNACISV